MSIGRRRILFLSIGAAAILAIALFAVVRALTPLPTVTLTDGNLVSLAGVTTGPAHSLTTGLPWDRMFRWLPYNLRQRLPSGTNHYDAPKFKSSLGVWFRSAKQIPYEAMVTVSGDDGIEVFSAGRSSEDGENVTFYSFPSFPSASKKLRVGILLKQTSDTYVRAGEFQFDNPLFQESVPTAARLPQTVSSDRLTVALQTLQVTPYRVSHLYEDLTHCCRAKATFDIVEHGDTRKRWRACKVKALDAYGIPLGLIGSSYGSSTQPHISFSPYPSPDSPWKLQVDFEKGNDFEPVELVTFENIPLPREANEAEVAFSQKVNGLDLILSKIIAPQGRPGEIEVVSRLSKSTPNTRVTLVTVKTDVSDRAARGGSSGSPEERRFGLYIPPHAKTVTLTFAVHQSHTLEFLAQPSVVASIE